MFEERKKEAINKWTNEKKWKQKHTLIIHITHTLYTFANSYLDATHEKCIQIL